MADNVVANPGVGGATFASDDIGGVQFPRSKLIIGADGVNDGDVSAANPLPVTGTVAVTGVSTAAKQDTIIGHIDGVETLLAGGLPAALGAQGALKVEGVASGTAIPVSSATLATAAKQPALGTAGIASSDVITVQGIASMTPLLATATGNVASDGVDSGNPVKVGAQARATQLTAVASADRVDLTADLTGKLIVRPFTIPELTLAGNPSVITGTGSTEVIAAQASGIRIYVTSLTVTNSDATVGTLVSITDGSGGTTLWQGYCASAGGGVAITFPVPLRTTAATALHAVCGTTSAEVYVSAQGFSAP